MFQPNRMNQIDNFFMRNNNQVTPKRSYSPRLALQDQQNHRQTQHLQYFPSNKQNILPNRNSISPNKVNFARKPMISNMGPACSNNIGPSLLVSPRSKGSHQGLIMHNNQGYDSNHVRDCHQPQVFRPQISNIRNTPANGGSNGLLKRLNHNGSQVQFVMSKGVQYCENHGTKLAEFSIYIEGQKMKYCSVCASKLASQGFKVVKISTQLQKKQLGRSLRKPKPLPSYPQYRGNPFYDQITKFLRQLISVQTNYYDTITKFSSLQQHYNQQIDITTQYYDQVLKILSQMKQQHLHDLNQQKQKYLQIADIQLQYLNENVEEINFMREDIQSNIPSIVQDIQQESFNNCVNEYRGKMTMLKHSIEEKEENFKDITEYQEEDLRKKVIMFENAIKELWQEDTDPQNEKNKVFVNNNNNQNKGNNHQFVQNKEQVTVKNMHEMLPKSSVQQTHGQGAFRHLFGDEQQGQQTLPIPSPQFKKI